MARLRPVLAPLAALWLFSQVAAMTLAPVTLWVNAANPHAPTCTCGHGPDMMCPMHHKPASSPTDCVMRAAVGSGAAVLTSLVSVAGRIPEPTSPIVPPGATPNFSRADAQVIGERPIPPDPPPPRA